MGYKAYSDGYLMSLTKVQIIELLRVAEHNFFATEEALNNSAKVGIEIAEKYDEAKRLLKAAVKDFAKLDRENAKNKNCMMPEMHCADCPLNRDSVDDRAEPCHSWRYTDEALKLIGGSENG